MIQKFLKFSKLKEYNYLFLSDFNQNIVKFNQINDKIKLIQPHWQACRISDFFDYYIYYLKYSLYYLSGTDKLIYIGEHVKASTNFKYYGNIVLIDNIPVIYFNPSTNTFIISSKISKEILNIFFYQLKRNFHLNDNLLYYYKYEYINSLDIECDIYVKDNQEYNSIKNIIYPENYYNNFFLFEDNYYCFDMLKIINTDLIKDKRSILATLSIDTVKSYIKQMKKLFIDYNNILTIEEDNNEENEENEEDNNEEDEEYEENQEYEEDEYDRMNI